MNPTAPYESVILSSSGMTKRLPDPADRRGRLVAVTDRGRALVDAAVVDQLANELVYSAPAPSRRPSDVS